MRSSGFKRNKAGLSSDEFVTPVKPRHNIGRIIYLTILLGILVFFGVYFFKKIFYINADGQVIFKNVDIRLTENARIYSFYKVEGDSVRKGDTLFSYIPRPRLDSRSGEFLLSSTDSTVSAYDNTRNKELINWLEREVFNQKIKIEANQVLYKSLNNLLKAKRKELKKVENLTVLEAVPRSYYENAIKDTLELRFRMDQVIAENRNLNGLVRDMMTKLDNLKVQYDSLTREYQSSVSMVNRNADPNNFSTGMTGEIEYFISPLNGFMNNIYLSEFETVTAQDNIVSIQQTNQIFIRAYFDQKDIDKLKENAVVKIVFPDNTRKKGYIKRFYYGTYTLPEEFQKRYESVKRTVAADIYPLSEDEAQHWKLFHKLGVKVSFSKY